MWGPFGAVGGRRPWRENAPEKRRRSAGTPLAGLRLRYSLLNFIAAPVLRPCARVAVSRLFFCGYQICA